MAQRNLKNNPIIRRRINANREVIEQNRMRLGLERTLRKQLVKVFDTIFRVAAGEIKQHGTVENTAESIEERLRKVLEPHYRKTIIMFSERAEEGLLTKGKTRFQTHINDFIAKEGGEKITQITNATRKQVQKIVADGATRGAGEAAIARDLRKKLGFSAKRAATIARTETHNAAIFANDAIDRENRGPEFDDRQKRWVSVADERTRSHHARMNGEQVGVDEDFKVPYNGNTYSMQRPGDPAGGAGNVINCRCVLVYIDAETEALQDGFRTQGTEEYNRWNVAKDSAEYAHHQRSWAANLVADLRTAIQNAAQLEYVEYVAVGGEAYNAHLKAIRVVLRPGEGVSLRDIEIALGNWRHEFGHHLDNRGNGRLWSALSTGEMTADAARYTGKFIAAAEQKAGLEIQKLGVKLNEGGAVTLKQVNKQLEGTGMNGRDLLRMMPDLRGATKAIRAQEMYRAATHIKHRNWNGLQESLESWDGKKGAWNSSADFMEALTDARLGSGHGRDYYHRFERLDDSIYTEDHTGEAFAEFIEITGGRDRVSWTRLLNRFAPKTVNSFGETLGKIARGE